MTTAGAVSAPQPGPLSSDHVNYLILRYLQEAGHEASATAFYRDWRRPAEFRDPEDLPFAPSVQRHELVSVIQDGLYHDELVSRVRKEGRRFNFTTNGAGSRPGTAGKGKGRLDQMRRGGTDDFPTPPPKRQRKSEEGPSQDRQINGAAEPMEVDAASPSAGDAEDDAEGASPAVQSPEPEVVEVPERYDSMDVAVQTEGKTGPKTSTMYWCISNPDAAILHNTFSPAKGSRTLFTAGEGISRFYDLHDLPSDFESGVDQISSLDDASTGSGSVVTACAWHPKGHALAVAVDMAREIGVAGKQERRQIIKTYDAKTLRTMQYHSPPLLEPQGLVIALRYSWDGSHLLALRTNGSRGTVEVWSPDSQTANGATHGVSADSWSVFEVRVLDAAWTSKSEFVVCGEDGLIQKFRLKSTQTEDAQSDKTHDLETARMRGLELVLEPVLPVDAQHLPFDKIRAPLPRDISSETSVQFVAVASDDRIALESISGSDDVRKVQLSPHNRRITGVAFRPQAATDSSADASTRGVLAIACESGYCSLQGTNADADQEEGRGWQLAGGSPALALAWSPRGSFVAVCGVDTVQIWEASSLTDRSQPGASSSPEPAVTWRRDKTGASKSLRNGEHAANGAANEDVDAAGLDPTLSWSADGETLALAVGNEIAVIRFRPPLHSSEEGNASINGHGT